MLSRVFTSSALLSEPSRFAQALNAIGLFAKAAIMLGVNPILAVNASSVGLDSAGTCSGAGTLERGMFILLERGLVIRRIRGRHAPAAAASAASCLDAQGRPRGA